MKKESFDQIHGFLMKKFALPTYKKLKSMNDK